MEVSRILVLCALVAVVYAKGHKSERLMPSDTCDVYASILGRDEKGKRYEECGADNDNGEKLCYLKSMECDSISDCPNQADEKKAGCTAKHQTNCQSDFAGKKTRDGSPLQTFQCDDGMCILGCQRCDGKVHCADSSDENSCTGDEVKPACQ